MPASAAAPPSGPFAGAESFPQYHNHLRRAHRDAAPHSRDESCDANSGVGPLEAPVDSARRDAAHVPRTTSGGVAVAATLASAAAPPSGPFAGAESFPQYHNHLRCAHCDAAPHSRDESCDANSGVVPSPSGYTRCCHGSLIIAPVCDGLATRRPDDGVVCAARASRCHAARGEVPLVPPPD